MVALKPSRRLMMVVPALPILLLAACSETSLSPPTVPALSSPPPAVTEDDATAASAPANIGGTWQWQQSTRFSVPPLEAGFLGIVPEGSMTHVTCQSGGTLTIIQSTASMFAGSATQSSSCRTHGGFVFNPVPVPFPAALDVANGEVMGRHFTFDFIAYGAACPQTGAIRIENGQAVELHGTGDCPLPEGLKGAYKDVTFTARR